MKLLTIRVLCLAAIAPMAFGNSLQPTVAMGNTVAEDAQTNITQSRRYRSQNNQYQGGTGRREILSYNLSERVIS